MVAVLAVLCVGIGVATEVALADSLYGQLDKQLTDASRHATGPRPPGSTAPPDGDSAGGPRWCQGTGGSVAPFPFVQGPGSLEARIEGGTVTEATVLSPDICQQPLSPADTATLRSVPVVNRPYTLQVGTYGDYRLVAARLSDRTVVTGLPLAPVYQTLWQLGFVIGGVTLGALVAAAVAGAFVVRRTLRPLRRVADTAGRVAELPLDRDAALSVRVPDGDTDPRTEVGLVGSALNRMLGHVGSALAARQASEDRMRQFLADASHELRTPLAAIRGYAELTRRSHDVVPPRIEHAMRRVESESARMTTLVNDLLLLARLDSGRPLESAPVDLSRLVVDVASDAHIAGPGHVWRLALPEEPIVVRGDAQRLHQVLANLLANARTHTPPGTVVTTGITVGHNGTVTLTVTDDGPGIPAALLPEVFERFARGDGSRSRGAGSTGLGLAIVAAVVAAHDGTVGVASEPGRTRFTVTLPGGTTAGDEHPVATPDRATTR
jgi:two-component system, OmpR family, sensor kinase